MQNHVSFVNHNLVQFLLCFALKKDGYLGKFLFCFSNIFSSPCSDHHKVRMNVDRHEVMRLKNLILSWHQWDLLLLLAPTRFGPGARVRD